MRTILKHWKDNRRRVYDEVPAAYYDREYYTTACNGHETFQKTRGRELGVIYRKVLSLAPLDRCEAALDIGCGRGEIVLALARRGVPNVIGIDYSDEALSLARSICEDDGRIALQRMDATRLDLASSTFDVAFMADIVEHLNDAALRRAIAEAHRVLKPGGTLVVHTMPCENYKLVGQYLVKAWFALKGREWWTPTSKEEAVLSHINIQSAASLREYLESSFSPGRVRVLSAPSNEKGALKKVIGALGLWRILSPHLWATAVK